MRLRLFAQLTLWVALALLFAPPEPVRGEERVPCPVCSDAKAVKCPGCAGNGKIVVPCETCGGAGKPTCGLVTGSPELQVLTAHEGKRRDCPNRLCRGGKVTWDDKKKYTCKVCRGRKSIQCDACTISGRKGCRACKGKKTVKSECRDCAGSGTLVCLRCVTGPACPRCEGKRSIECIRCKGEKSCRRTCPVCLGVRAYPCRACWNTGRVVCRGCSGCGKERGKFTDTLYTKKCSKCDGKGTTDCRPCFGRGTAWCSCHKNEGQVRGDCRHCLKTGRIGCPTCGDRAYRAAEIQAGILARGGHRKEAIELYQLALTRLAAEATEAKQETARLAKAVPDRPRKPEDPGPGSKSGQVWFKIMTRKFERLQVAWDAHRKRFLDARKYEDDLLAAKERIKAARAELTRKLEGDK